MPMLPCDLEPLYSLLACITDSENARSISEKLLETYGSMDRIFSSHISELKTDIPGTEEFKSKVALYLETAKAITRRRKIDNFHTGEPYNEVNVGKFLMSLFLFEPMEKVYMLFYDAKMRYVGIELVSSGTVNTSHITIRRALEISLRHNASYVVIAHNHPFGKSTPSPDDITTTHNLSSAFTEIGLKLLEHFVVGASSVTKVSSLSSESLR